MLNNLKALRESQREEGFTLIELMIVVVIIGILAAIAIPIFANQQQAAVGSTLKADVRNTRDAVATFLVNNPTANAAALATVTPVVTGSNRLTITGQWDAYTVKAENLDGSPNCYLFTSTTGKITECQAQAAGTIGDPSAVTGGNATAVIKTLPTSGGGVYVGNRFYEFPQMGFQIHEDGGVTVSTNNSPVTYTTPDGTSQKFNGTIKVALERVGPSIRGTDTVTVVVKDGQITGATGSVNAEALGIAGGNPGDLWISEQEYVYTDA